MSSDHRRERPPDQKRECRPAGTERQISKAQQSIDNSNAQINSLIKFQKQGARHPAPRAARRLRYVDEIETSADARARWWLFIERLGIEFDDDLIDRLLDEAVGADVGAIRLHECIRGAP